MDLTRIDLVLTLLQLVALALPAIVIYMDVLYGETDPREFGDGKAANYQAVRLTFVWVSVAGVSLLLNLLLAGLISQALGSALTAAAICFLILGFATFLLPVLFDEDGLQTEYRIWWVYQNAWHRLRNHLG